MWAWLSIVTVLKWARKLIWGPTCHAWAFISILGPSSWAWDLEHPALCLIFSTAPGSYPPRWESAEPKAHLPLAGPVLFLLISGKPVYDSGRGGGGVGAPFTPKSWVFNVPFLLLIYLCFQKLLEHWVLWKKANCELHSCFSYKKWEFIFISILLCDEVSIKTLKWKEITNYNPRGNGKCCNFTVATTP